jgi:uncharacterized coiled-coil protein SlyX
VAAVPPPTDEGEIISQEQCRELQAEVARLRLLVARLEDEKAALVRAAAVRDYERPPHY